MTLSFIHHLSPKGDTLVFPQIQHPPDSSDKYLLSIYYVQGTVLDIWDKAVNKRGKISALVEILFFLEEIDNKK